MKKSEIQLFNRNFFGVFWRNFEIRERCRGTDWLRRVWWGALALLELCVAFFISFLRFLIKFCLDFATKSRKEWRVSFFNQICENKLEICRKFWNMWKLFNITVFNIIHSYSFVSLCRTSTECASCRSCSTRNHSISRRGELRSSFAFGVFVASIGMVLGHKARS